MNGAHGEQESGDASNNVHVQLLRGLLPATSAENK